ncbi:hypothetical protein [Salmon gill poxvirus]
MSHSIVIKFNNGTEMQVTECAYLSEIRVVPDNQQAWVEFNPIVRVKDMVFDSPKSLPLPSNYLQEDFNYDTDPLINTKSSFQLPLTRQVDVLTQQPSSSFTPYGQRTGLGAGDMSVKSKRALHKSAMTNFLSTINADD